MDKGYPLEPGDVVQIDPALKNSFFSGCFMTVTDLRPWGVIGFILTPETRTGPGRAYFNAHWEQMEFVGKAPWAPVNIAGEVAHDTHR